MRREAAEATIVEAHNWRERIYHQGRVIPEELPPTLQSSNSYIQIREGRLQTKEAKAKLINDFKIKVIARNNDTKRITNIFRALTPASR